MRCPHCGSTDIADLVTKPREPEKRVCLDCDGTWVVGGRRG